MIFTLKKMEDLQRGEKACNLTHLCRKTTLIKLTTKIQGARTAAVTHSETVSATLVSDEGRLDLCDSNEKNKVNFRYTLKGERIYIHSTIPPEFTDARIRSTRF